MSQVLRSAGISSSIEWGGKVAPATHSRMAKFLSLAIAAKIVILFCLAWNTRFVMDEFVQLGWAKFLDDQLFVTIWPIKAVGFALFYKLAHLIGWDAESTLLLGRLQTAVIACATLGLIYGCARALRRNQIEALATLVVLLSFSNFMERSFRTIAEPLAVFWAAVSLLVILRGDADRARTVLIAGFLTGLAFLTTQKSIYFNLALGVALVGDALLQRRIVPALTRGSLLVAGWLVAVGLYSLALGGTNAASVIAHLFLAPVDNAAHGADPYGNLRGYVLQTLLRNLLLYLLCLGGLIYGLVRVTKMDQSNRVALIFTFVVTVFVFSHNQPWPYVFIMALPFLALWSTELFRAAGGKAGAGAWAMLIVGLAGSFIANFAYLRHDNAGQLDLVGRAEAVLGSDETYFDGVGMLPNRREATGIWLDRQAVMRTLREGEDSEVARMFKHSPPKVVMWSYRLDAISPVVRRPMESGYVRISPNLWMAGRLLTPMSMAAFEAPIAGRYSLYDSFGRPASGVLRVDGRTVGGSVRLQRGSHTVSLLSGTDAVFLLPEGSYSKAITSGDDNEALFEGVYD